MSTAPAQGNGDTCAAQIGPGDTRRVYRRCSRVFSRRRPPMAWSPATSRNACWSSRAWATCSPPGPRNRSWRPSVSSHRPTPPARKWLGQLAHCDDVKLDEYLAATLRALVRCAEVARPLAARPVGFASRRHHRSRRCAGGQRAVRTHRSRSRDGHLWFPFCTRNRSVFHEPSGAGYRLFVDEVAVLMPLNPGLVIRLVGDLPQFQRFDEQSSGARCAASWRRWVR